MNDNLQPHPDDHLEARITAYVLGESSPFESAELEALIEKSPELQLFLHRTRTLHTLLAEAETTSNLPDKNWKLPPGKRAKLAALLGETPETQALKPKKSKILKFTGFAIAACAILTAFLITLINPHTFQQKAAEIVTYQTTGNGPAPEQAQANIEELKRLVQEQEDKVEERRKVLATISRTKNIAHRGERQLGLEEDRVARYAEVKVNELETKTTELETQIESLSSFDDSQLLIYASGLDLPDNVIKTLYPQTRELERQIDGLKASGLSEKHPKVVTNKRVLDSMNKDLGEGVINLRSRLQDQLRQSKEQLAKAEARRDESKRDSVEKNIDTLEWIDAKKDFETDLATLEQLELKLNAATIEAEISSQTTNSHASGRIAKNPKTPRPKRQSSVNSSTGAPSIPPAPPESEALAKNEMNFDDGADFGRGRGYETPSDSTPESAIDIGGMVEKPGSLEFKEGTTLGEAIASAGGATEFGSEKRVKLYREGKVKTYDVTDSSLAQLKLQPGDTIEMPQKNWLGCGASRDEAILSESTQQRDKSELSKDPATAGALTAGRRSGEQAIASESTEDTLNIPDRAGSLAMFENTGGETDETQPDAFSSPQDEKSNVRSLRIVEAELKALKDEIEDPSINDSKKQHLFGVWQKKQQEAIASQNQLGDAAIAKAKQLRMEGKHEEALAVLDTANKENFRTEFGYLDDTISSNSSFYKEHKKNVEDVRRNLHLADGNFDLGKYDEAKDSYEQILRTDPYNQAARRGMERIAATKSDYYRAAYDQTRAELLMKVDDAWELSVPAEADSFWGDNLSSSEALTFYKPQIDITTKFVETNQTNNRELGIGWLFRPSQNEPEVAGFDGFMNYGRPIADTADPFADESDDALRERHAYLKKTIEAPIQIKKQALFKEWKEINQELARREAAKPTLTDLSQESPASQDPFSTFSLNISDTSFQLARAAIAKGERPDPASIKPEQFYNAIDYNDPVPSSSQPVAAAIDQTAHPVIPGRNLVRIALRTAATGRSAAQPLRLTLLVDQSGSMVRQDRRTAMENALAQLATLLTEKDQVTVIGFSRTPRLLADSLPGTEAKTLPTLINQTASEGGTNLEQAITLASELALRHKLEGAQNRIVLFTDGAANLGNADPTRLSKKIETLRQQSIAFDIAGIGTTDLNDTLLSELARHGNGRYYLVGENTSATFAKQLAGAFRPAAENVKVQVKLNPDRVGNFKLLGFEKDRLKTEDFRNDSVDAAELAAEEAGVAMYQIETLPEGTGEIGEVSVRFRQTSTGNMVERTWTIPYDQSAPSFDQANPKTQLATLALLAAQKLQGGPLADAINLNGYSKTVAKLKQSHANDPKTIELLTLVESLK